ncbi:MAG: efflux RND transporter periplasmic adaptor subunit [Thermodesulfovibrio sp.]|nr:efflux RND transporter periplasmic adaptor subunit [Thermodesulfovibrio sp.]
MKKHKAPFVILLIFIIMLGSIFIVNSLKKASAPYEKGKAPNIEDSPARVYGRVEPLGREVFIGPQQARRVVKIYVNEGQNIKKGDVLLKLDSEVERQAYYLAVSKVAEFERKLDLVLDELRRKNELLREEIIPEFNVTQKKLEAKLIEQQIEVARQEAKLRKKELETLILRSPVDGVIYKFDVRLGELLTPENYERIIIGKPQKQVRLFIESFWIDKIKIGDKFIIKDAETNREIGKAKVIYISEYVGSRDFRTEDALERIDTKYVQAIVEFEKAQQIKIGKLVLCERIRESQ